MRQRRKCIVLALVMALTLSNISVPQVEAKSKTPSVKKSITLTVGKKKTIKVTGSKIKSKKFSVTKGKKYISVSKKGIVKAKKVGTAKVKVTVKYKSGKKLKSKKLYVKVKVVNKVTNTTVTNKPSVTTKPSASSTAPSVTTSTPSAKPSEKPSAKPTETPSAKPSEEPSATPSEEPSSTPSETPSAEPTETPALDLNENGLVVKSGRLTSYSGSAKTLSIPEGVTEIAENALEDAEVKSIELPSTLQTIGARAFKGCSNLEDIDCPDTVVGVGDYACEDCTALESISIPNEEAEIGEAILEGCVNLTSAYIPAASGCSHEYMKIKIDANCTQNGTNISICKDCGDIVNNIVNALGHDIEVVRIEPTCVKDGMEKKVCKRCDSIIDVTTIDALGHDYKDEVTKPTCTEKGYTTHTCSRCDDSYIDSYVDALGHDFIGWVTNIPATCTEKGKQVGVCSRCSLESFRDLLATGHTYGTPVYKWSDDGSSCTATRTCENDSSHVETEEAVIKSSVETSATCENKGTTRYTATFENEAFDTQTKDIADIPAIGHDWGDVTYSWSDTGDKCTATRVCKNDSSHTESEEVSTTSSVKTNPTCTEKGVTEYVATFSNEVFGTETKDIVDIPATGHDWGESIYGWSEDGKSCTATRTCGNDSEHIETEDATVTSAVETPAGCTEKGTTKYTAVFKNEAFETQKKSVIDIPATGHNWGETIYSWSNDGKSCTAKRICQNDSNHVETENANITNRVKTEATCTEKGITEYKATFENNAFVTQTKDVVDIEATGHSWGEVSYSWSDDGKSCIAKRICENDSNHVETESGVIKDKIKVNATCTKKGTTEYTATFENDAFTTQTKDVIDIPATGHSYGEPKYTWSSDYKSCTATRVCENDSNHVETEVGAVTSNIKTSATCTEKGATTYTAVFSNSAFTTQIKDVVDIPATGHSYGTVSYTWSADNRTCTAKRVCENDPSHIEKEDSTVKLSIKESATCEFDGTTTYTAEFENPVFETQTKDIRDIDAIGHSYGEPVYTWSSDGKSCTAKRVCNNDSSHVETENATINSNIKIPATCLTNGTTEYTAEFENNAFVTQTKDVVDIPAIGHNYGEVSYTWSTDGKSCTAKRVCQNDAGHVESEDADITSKVKVNATCTEKGTTTYTATFTNSAFATQAKDVVDIPAVGHSYGEVSYSWSDDGKSCTATRTCGNDSEHIETEDAKIDSDIKIPATCEDDGTTTYTATFSNTAFTTQTKDVVDIPAIGHDWNEPVYGWYLNIGKCIAQASCKNDDTHIASEAVSYSTTITKQATCTEKGSKELKATFNNSLFKTQTCTETIAATGHTWGTPTYTWSADGKSCTAKVICSNDASHIIEESGTIKSAVKTPAKCTVKGTTTYTATFTNALFTAQTKDVQDIAATGHTWGTPTYTWSSDGKSCTAKRVCTKDSSHVETCTGTMSSKVKTAATCIKKGTTTYTARFSNSAFTTQTKDVQDISATGHSWGTPTYTWSSDGKSCKVKRVCSKNSSHTETDCAKISSKVKTAATCTAKGTTTYTATFTNTAFTTQTKDVQDIAAKGHSSSYKVNLAYSGKEGDVRYLSKYCARCGATLESSIAYFTSGSEHSLGSYSEVPASYSQPDLVIYEEAESGNRPTSPAKSTQTYTYLCGFDDFDTSDNAIRLASFLQYRLNSQECGKILLIDDLNPTKGTNVAFLSQLAKNGFEVYVLY